MNICENMLRIIFEQKPIANSRYKLYGCPPLYDSGIRDEFGNMVLIRPVKVMQRIDFGYVESDGIAVEIFDGKNFIGQAAAYTFDGFENKYGTKKELRK